MKNSKKIEDQVGLVLKFHAAIEEATASSIAAKKSFVSAFITLANSFALSGENRREFYTLFPSMETDKTLAGRIKTACTRYLQYLELTGECPSPETGLPQRGYGSLKGFADKVSAKSDSKETIITLFKGLTPDLQKDILKSLQAIVSPVKAKTKPKTA